MFLLKDLHPTRRHLFCPLYRPSAIRGATLNPLLRPNIKPTLCNLLYTAATCWPIVRQLEPLVYNLEDLSLFESDLNELFGTRTRDTILF